MGDRGLVLKIIEIWKMAATQQWLSCLYFSVPRICPFFLHFPYWHALDDRYFHPDMCLCEMAVCNAKVAVGKGEETVKLFLSWARIGNQCSDVHLLDSVVIECVFRVVNSTLWSWDEGWQRIENVWINSLSYYYAWEKEEKHCKLGHRGLRKFSGTFWQEKLHFWICFHWHWS